MYERVVAKDVQSNFRVEEDENEPNAERHCFECLCPVSNRMVWEPLSLLNSQVHFRMDETAAMTASKDKRVNLMDRDSLLESQMHNKFQLAELEKVNRKQRKQHRSQRISYKTSIGSRNSLLSRFTPEYFEGDDEEEEDGNDRDRSRSFFAKRAKRARRDEDDEDEGEEIDDNEERSLEEDDDDDLKDFIAAEEDDDENDGDFQGNEDDDDEGDAESRKESPSFGEDDDDLEGREIKSTSPSKKKTKRKMETATPKIKKDVFSPEIPAIDEVEIPLSLETVEEDDEIVVHASKRRKTNQILLGSDEED